MKNLVLVIAFVFISTSIFAQKRKDLKGPAYKNYKVWEHKSEPTPIFVNTNKKDLKGPAYKNYKPWRDNSKKTKIVVVSSKRSKLTGPAYKNYKPWRDEQ